MKARIIPPPERADDRTEEEKRADLEALFKRIEVTNMMRSIMSKEGGLYYDFPGSPIVPDNFGVS